jgi:hypothetical protein
MLASEMVPTDWITRMEKRQVFCPLLPEKKQDAHAVLKTQNCRQVEVERRVMPLADTFLKGPWETGGWGRRRRRLFYSRPCLSSPGKDSAVYSGETCCIHPRNRNFKSRPSDPKNMSCKL